MNKVRLEDGIVIGNVVDKSQIKNPISRYLVANFDQTLIRMIRKVTPSSLHEIGCGEGRLTRILLDEFRVPVRASDFSSKIINDIPSEEFEGVEFVHRNIYDLVRSEDHADVVLCCEVLEHLDEPDLALKKLRHIEARKYLFSVPFEPLWRFLNLIRGAYLLRLGNTPGHIQHWSPKSFSQLLDSQGFSIQEVHTPLPWIMVIGSFNR